jgi:hypothetical protein
MTYKDVVQWVNKYTNYLFSLLIMYGSSYMFWHYIAMLNEMRLNSASLRRH